jgi:hypothetical protein
MTITHHTDIHPPGKPSGPIDHLAYNRRVTDQLLYYWLMKKGKRRFPRESDIAPADLPEAWKFCFLVQARDVTKEDLYNYTYFGDALRESYELGILEDGVLPMISPRASLLYAKHMDVVRTGKPLIESGEGLSYNNIILYRQCFLPLGQEGGPVDFILGCMNYKIVKNT